MQASRLPFSDDGRSAPFDTAEARWFANGDIPQRLVQLFCDTAPAVDMEIRDDKYCVTGSDSVGLKRRNGGPIEIKQRLSSGGTVYLRGGISAPIEDWRKETRVDPLEMGDDDQWIEVTKVVMTRTYALNGRGVVRAGQDLAEPGCDVELASIVVRDREAWTFALEAWGADTDRHELLSMALAAFLTETPLAAEYTGALEHAMSYPAWLAGFADPDPG